MITLLEDYMKYRRYKYFRLDGQTELEDRRIMVTTFQRDPSYFCFILSTRAGGLGINLTQADTVVFYDNDWNPTCDAQAMDRVHRIGQTKQVTVYRLVCKNTVEENILKRAQVKFAIQKSVYSGGFKMTSRLISDREGAVDANTAAGIGEEKKEGVAAGEEGAENVEGATGVDMVEEDFGDDDAMEGDVGDADEDVDANVSVHKKGGKPKQHGRTGLDAVFQSNELKQLLFEADETDGSSASAAPVAAAEDTSDDSPSAKRQRT